MNEPSSNPPNRRSDRSVFGWLLLPFALFPLLALVTFDARAIAAVCNPPQPSSNLVGALGDNFAYYGYLLVGFSVWTIPLVCLAAGLLHAFGHAVRLNARKAWLLVSLLAVACLFEVLGTHAPVIASLTHHLNLSSAGGAVGYLAMTRCLVPLLSPFAATVLVLVVLAMSLVAAIGFAAMIESIRTILAWATATTRAPTPPQTGDKEDEARYAAEQAQYLAALKAKDDAARQKAEEKAAAKAAKEAEREAIRAAKAAARAETRAAKRKETESGDGIRPPTAGLQSSAASTEPEDRGPYLLPPIDLLSPLPNTKADHGDIDEMSTRLVDTLKLFNIDATVAYTVPGPVVTKYALNLAPGTRYSAVTGVSDNLMGALRAKSIRIEAPIPGEDAVGVEVPNRTPIGITFREIFESSEWRDSKAELPLLFGKRADGKVLVSDLATMPHMLVAGATGQGKSVCLNAIINGLLMSRTPEQLKLIMVDPKSVEFTSYASIPHLLVPVITDNRKVVYSLHWAVVEMEKRLKLFARARVRNIYDFNHRPAFTQTDMFGADEAIGSDMPRTVPYIVIIIDEVADLMSSSAKEVTPDISRLTAKARAAGIHLILATQRPDAKVITGTIKANIPGRVAFKTATGIDSRTILDDGGAENLIGRGDMLFKGKDGILIRAQGAWISDAEIARVTAFIEKHSTTQFDETFATKLGRVKEAAIDDPFASNEDDPDNQPAAASEAKAAERAQVKAAENASDFKKAIECIINTNRASTSHFQRQMGWGYNHAAKILDMLAARGIVSQQQGMGARQIVMDQNQLVAILNAGEGEDAADTAAAVAAAPAPDDAAPTGAEADLFTEENT